MAKEYLSEEDGATARSNLAQQLAPRIAAYKFALALDPNTVKPEEIKISMDNVFYHKGRVGKVCRILKQEGVLAGVSYGDCYVLYDVAMQLIKDLVSDGKMLVAEPGFKLQGAHPKNMKLDVEATPEQQLALRTLSYTDLTNYGYMNISNDQCTESRDLVKVSRSHSGTDTHEAYWVALSEPGDLKIIPLPGKFSALAGICSKKIWDAATEEELHYYLLRNTLRYSYQTSSYYSTSKTDIDYSNNVVPYMEALYGFMATKMPEAPRDYRNCTSLCEAALNVIKFLEMAGEYKEQLESLRDLTGCDGEFEVADWFVRDMAKDFDAKFAVVQLNEDLMSRSDAKILTEYWRSRNG